MRWSEFWRSRGRFTYFHRLVWLVCVSVCVPVVLAGSVYYKLSVSRLTDEWKAQQSQSLELVVTRVEELLGSVEYQSLRLAGSQLIRDSLADPDFPGHYVEQARILEEMAQIVHSNTIIDDIVYYNRPAGVVLSNEYGHVLFRNPRYWKDLDAAVAGDKKTEWLHLPEAAQMGYITHMRRLSPSNSDAPQGVLLFHLNEERLARELSHYSDLEQELDYAVFDSGGNLLFSRAGNTGLIRDLPAKFEKYFGKGESGVAFDRDARTFYFYRHTLMNRTYIVALPEKAISRQVHWIKMMILYTIGIFMAVGLMMSYITSRLAYNPIERLIRQGRSLVEKGNHQGLSGNELSYISACLHYLDEQAEALKRHLQMIEPDVKEQFLLRLVKGRKTYGRTVREEARRLRIPHDEWHVVMVATPEKLYKEKRFLPGEEPILTFAISNVMKELLQKAGLRGYVINGDDNEVIAILCLDGESATEEWLSAISRYAESVCVSVKQYLSLKMSVGIGKPCPGLERTPESYREALLALQYRIYKNGGSVYWPEEEETRKKQRLFSYPRELEAEIIESLSEGDMQMAEQHIREFARVVNASESYNLVYQSYHILLSSLIRSLEMRGIGLLDIMENNWFDQLQSLQSGEEIVEWFIDVLFPLYSNILEQNRKFEGRNIVQRVSEYVKENICKDITLSQCAELVNISPFYLSRLFRRESGKSFVDFVMECKVEEAKRLLRDTDMSVAEVARAVGYSERNLNRLFQRMVQQTPGQYRILHR